MTEELHKKQDLIEKSSKTDETKKERVNLQLQYVIIKKIITNQKIIVLSIL